VKPPTARGAISKKSTVQNQASPQLTTSDSSSKNLVRPPVVSGAIRKSSSTPKAPAAVTDPDFNIRVTNLHPDTTEASLSRYVESKFKIKEVHCKLITPKIFRYKAKFLSFKLSIPASKVDKVKNPRFWTKGTVVSVFKDTEHIKTHPTKNTITQINSQVPLNPSKGNTFKKSDRSKYTNFQFADVLNPTDVPNKNFIDPLKPPIVRCTQQFAGDINSNYVLSRLRDQRTYEMVRVYLAYLHNQDDYVHINGRTKMNTRVLIQAEGLPGSYKELRDIYYKYNESLNISPKDITKDLETYRSYLSNERLGYLQRTKNNHNWLFPSKS